MKTVDLSNVQNIQNVCDKVCLQVSSTIGDLSKNNSSTTERSVAGSYFLVLYDAASDAVRPRAHYAH